ncbi:acyl-CoA thioesterase [Naasia lichenicola]|uniref:Acyl-CoA thioesterase n=1 Tax=Naasia lichenicola TaxID=2565933 RepID=A0A4S4FSC3_9MICO|nr:acyl-CoA thioesterase [Naasia lichenicola]
MLLITLSARRGPRLDPLGISRINGRVWPTDIDEFRHVNNGVYLSLLDHARLDLLERSGLWSRIRAAGVYPVVSMQTVSYRKSLKLGQRYVIETRIAGFDERSVFIEQRFVVAGEIYVRAYVVGRFLRERGGVVSMGELAEITGVDIASVPVPAWLADWAEASRLPSTRDDAPSEWQPLGS